MKTYTCALLLMATLVPSVNLSANDAEETSTSPKKVAIFVSNRSSADHNTKIPVFRDLLIGEVSDLGYQLISEDIVSSALSDLEQSGERNALDKALSDQSSALSLANNLGADYLLIGSLLSFDHESREVNAYNVSFTNHLYTLRGNYRFIDGTTGAVITSGNVAPTRTFQQTKHSETKAPALINELLGKAAQDIAANLNRKSDQLKSYQAEEKAGSVEITINVALNDLNFPEVTVDGDGNATIDRNSTLEVKALGVNVEVDGILVGTTATGDEPAKIQVPAGLHRLRLSREDLQPWERMVNFRDGMDFGVTMQLTASAQSRWRETTQLLDDLKSGAILTAAEAEEIRGMAEMLRNSGYKVDIKEDIKVDTDEAVQIHNKQSLMSTEN